jgi:hypothetical protein
MALKIHYDPSVKYKELHNLYPSQNIIWVIKSRWAKYVARMKEMKMHSVLENLKGRDHLEVSYPDIHDTSP